MLRLYKADGEEEDYTKNKEDWKMNRYKEFYDPETGNDPLFNKHILQGESKAVRGKYIEKSKRTI